MITFTTTTNFIIQYNPDQPDAMRRAKALAASCEADFARALVLFGITDHSGVLQPLNHEKKPDYSGFGAANPITVIVDIPIDSGKPIFGAYNQGYAVDGIPAMVIDPLNEGSNDWTSCGLQGDADQPIADDLIRYFFVSELVEILMAYRIQIINKNKPTTWDPRSSDGEGLSRLCGELFYPGVCYRYSRPPNITAWMQSDRSANVVQLIKNCDWVSINGFNHPKPDPSYGDAGDEMTFGCAMLFLYYLTTQLGISLTTVIVNGGLCLQDTYTNLRALAKNGQLNCPQLLQADAHGYTALVTLINQFFPVGNTPAMTTDNPFPLLNGNDRKVSLSYVIANNYPQKRSKSGTINISAGGNCPPKEYSYQIIDQIQVLLFKVTTYGFGQPRFAWSVCGQDISRAAINYQINVHTTVRADQPNEPGAPTSQSQSVDLTWSDASPTSGTLSIQNPYFPGHILIPVQVSVTEAYAANGASQASRVATLDAEFIQYEDQFYKDRTTCLAALKAKLGIGNPRWINILLTLPDPEPDQTLDIFMFDKVLQELQVIAEKQPAVAQSVAKALSARLGLSANRIMALASQSRTE